MPGNREHCDSSYSHVGIAAKDLHRWMDEPSKKYGIHHRKYRHNPFFPPIWAIRKYGYWKSNAIMRDHVGLDKRDTRRKMIQRWKHNFIHDMKVLVMSIGLLVLGFLLLMLFIV